MMRQDRQVVRNTSYLSTGDPITESRNQTRPAYSLESSHVAIVIGAVLTAEFTSMVLEAAGGNFGLWGLSAATPVQRAARWSGAKLRRAAPVQCARAASDLSLRHFLALVLFLADLFPRAVAPRGEIVELLRAEVVGSDDVLGEVGGAGQVAVVSPWEY